MLNADELAGVGVQITVTRQQSFALRTLQQLHAHMPAIDLWQCITYAQQSLLACLHERPEDERSTETDGDAAWDERPYIQSDLLLCIFLFFESVRDLTLISYAHTGTLRTESRILYVCRSSGHSNKHSRVLLLPIHW